MTENASVDMENMLPVKVGTVMINGKRRPVMKHANGRLHAGDTINEDRPFGGDGRTWNAMTMEILQSRIHRTFKL